MKHVSRAATVALALMLLPALAISAEEKKTARQEAMETCASYADIAGNIMTLRQQGAEMAEMMRGAKGNRFTEDLISEAFAKPKFSTKSFQLKKITDFKNEAYARCFKGIPR